MNHHYKGKAKNILAWLSASLLVVITLYSNAAGVKDFYFHISLTQDTIPSKKEKGKEHKLNQRNRGRKNCFQKRSSRNIQLYRYDKKTF